MNGKVTEEDKLEFCRIFEMPSSFSGYVGRLFSREEITTALSAAGKTLSAPDYDETWLKKEYRRGFISKTGNPGEYRLNNLYGMLDVFAVSRKEEYDLLFTPEEKHRLDDWYFETYFKGLTPDENGRLTEDRVMTLQETIDRIMGDPRPVYLNYCDCRSLTGDCGKPRKTCLTYKDQINSFVDRGLSIPLTKEEAVRIVEEADREGLMHTTMSGGICNCCSDCCYLFRSQRRAGTYGLWPASSRIVSFDESLCIGCGKCTERCWMKVFSRQGKKIQMDDARCVGCGLCVNTCPKQALTLVRRDDR